MAKELLKKDEKIIQKLLVPRLLKGSSSVILLTNNRIIYNKGATVFGFNFKFINLSDITNIAYQPMALHSGGLIKVITNEGKNITISPSYVGQENAIEFNKKVEKLIQNI